MASSPGDTSSREARLHAVLHGHAQALDAGQAPDPQTLLQQHPDLAPELGALLADRDRFDRLVHVLRAGLTVTAAPESPIPGLPPTVDHQGPHPASGPGEMIHYFGDYELLEEIARGGMGVVYKARQVSLNRIVALKMILSGDLATEADLSRFRKEAEAAAQLDHPGIVPVFEIDAYQGRQYLAMAFINGRSLASWLAKGPLENRLAAGLVQAIAEAIHYAHQRGVIHRDLKPGNVLIDKDGSVKVTDFGIAHRLGLEPLPSTGAAGELEQHSAQPVTAAEPSRLTVTGVAMGTPSYMAPEQALDAKSAGPLADVYSLGAVLYALLTGRPPLQAATVRETLRQVIEDDPVAPRELNPAVDHDLETVCLKCLQKDPSQRYASAADLAADLGRWRAGQPIQARTAGFLERSLRFAQTSPITLPVLVGLLIQQIAGLQEGIYVACALAGLSLPVQRLRARQVPLGLLVGFVLTAMGIAYLTWLFAWPPGSTLEYLVSCLSGAVCGAVLAAGYDAFRPATAERRPELVKWYVRGLAVLVLGLVLVPLLFVSADALRLGSATETDFAIGLTFLLSLGILLAGLFLFVLVPAYLLFSLIRALFRKFPHPFTGCVLPLLFLGAVLFVGAALLENIQHQPWYEEWCRLTEDLKTRFKDYNTPLPTLLEVGGVAATEVVSWAGAFLLGIASGILLGHLGRRLGALQSSGRYVARAAFTWGAVGAVLLTQGAVLVLSRHVGPPFWEEHVLRFGPGPAAGVAAAATAWLFPSPTLSSLWPAVALVKVLLLGVPMLVGALLTSVVVLAANSRLHGGNKPS